jgi:hypothetical protein
MTALSTLQWMRCEGSGYDVGHSPWCPMCGTAVPFGVVPDHDRLDILKMVHPFPGPRR